MSDQLSIYDGIMYNYTAFGLSLASEIMLPELVKSDVVKHDVTIKLGKVPDSFENIIISKPSRIIGKNKLIMDIPDIAKFFVESGSNITIEPYEDAKDEEIQLYLLGSCMGAILFQRGTLPLHGSCLNMQGQGILLTGISGAGKSTVTAALLSKGCGSMLTDDVAAVALSEDGCPIVYSSYPSQKLWEDALTRMDKKVSVRRLNRLSKELNKYAVPNRESFHNHPVVLRRIYEIIPKVTTELRFEEVTGVEKLGVIIQNTYRRFFVRGFDCKEWHFRYCANIASNVTVCRIIRPQGRSMEQEIADQIVSQINLLKIVR